MTSPLPTRRQFILRGALLGTTALLPGWSGAFEYGAGAGMPWAAGASDPPRGPGPERYFTPAERRTVEAITARLIPSDEEGPGAPEAGVAEFIDRDLAGFYGRGERWYMEGPFPEDPLPTQGYQARQTPAELWRDGLAAIDAHCRATFGGRDFAALDPADQDAVLTGLEEEEIELDGLPGKGFFEFMMEMTVEGFFCDPVHGGNRDMVGWTLVGFPGPRYDTRPFLDHDGRALGLAPLSLLGRPDWMRAGAAD